MLFTALLCDLLPSETVAFSIRVIQTKVVSPAQGLPATKAPVIRLTGLRAAPPGAIV